jgi:hypothetical protein
MPSQRKKMSCVWEKNVAIKAIVDIGSSVNLLNKSVFKEIKKKESKHPGTILTQESLSVWNKYPSGINR